MRPKLVIFDLDGTLLDTVEDVADCFNMALREHRFPERSLDEIASLVGGDLETIVSRLLPSDASQNDVSEVKASYRRLYAASEKPKTHPYAGVQELLDALYDQGVSLAVNTNKGQDLAESCLRKYFPSVDLRVVGLVDGIPAKPNPCGANRLINEFSCAPDEAVYVGDGLSDALTARNARTHFVFCSWGQGSRDDAIAAFPSAFLVNSIRELADYLGVTVRV